LWFPLRSATIRTAAECASQDSSQSLIFYLSYFILWRSNLRTWPSKLWLLQGDKCTFIVSV
jgi:hypothetical protein